MRLQAQKIHKRDKLLGLFLVLGTLFVPLAGCNPFAGTDWTEVRSLPSESEELILDYNLQHYVPVPVAGERPVKSVSTRADLDIAVVWRDQEGRDITGSLDFFREGEVYQAEITLMAKEGCRFDRRIPFAYDEGMIEDQRCDDNSHPTSRTIALRYKATRVPQPVDQTDLTPYIPAPVTGATGIGSFSAPQYRGIVAWKAGGTAHTGPFAANTAYTAVVSLSPGAGYTLTGLAGNPFTHAGAAGPPAYDGAARTVTLDFAATAKGLISGPIDLTLYFPAPAIGAAPAAALAVPAGSPFTGPVGWEKTADGSPQTGPFEADTAYTAAVTLKAGADYQFAPNITVSYPGAVVENTAYPDDATVSADIKFAALPFVVRSFGPADTTPDSALKLMAQKKDDRAPLEILLPLGMEAVSPGLVLIKGNTSPAELVIDGGGRVLRLAAASKGSIISVGDGVTLTLRNITLRGCAGNNAPLVEAVRGGTLILEDGALIKDNDNAPPRGDGGGAAAADGGTLILDGGTITDNTALYGGGVLVDQGGTFMVYGGTITGNTALNRGGGVQASGAAASFKMSGGTISHNISMGEGGGIYVSNTGIGAISISNAVIRNNTAGRNGGGIFAVNTNITMEDSSIRDNRAEFGGGVMFGSGTAVSNKVFDMKKGEILNNTAISAGGGAHVQNNGAFQLNFDMDGGTIQANSSPQGSGVYLSKANIRMRGAAQINPNNPVLFSTAPARIVIMGSLLIAPAAAIEGSFSNGQILLDGMVSAHYDKFLCKGQFGKIDGTGKFIGP